MFRHVGRRLAILNTVIVIVLIASIGALTYGALRRSLRQEVDQALEERLAVALSGSLSVDSSILGATPDVVQEGDEDEDEESEDDEDDDDEEHERDREIVSSGDTILILIGPDGQVAENPRDVTLPGVPVSASVEEALSGRVDARSITLAGGEQMRVMSAPIVQDGQITGAIQALRSLSEHEEQLEIVRNMTILGVALGIVIAGPAGYFLSRRAMVPINAAFSRQRAFVADASHEIRTPLTLIRANAEYARRKPVQPVSDVLPSLDNIVREVDHMSNLVNDLLTLARLDAGKLELDLTREDLATVVESAVESMRPLASAAGVNLTIDDGKEALALVDRVRIEQVARILLDNAIRHTPPDGQVTACVTVEGSWRVVQVRDTGSGIAADELPYVFDRFSRQDAARDREHGGTGLGLAIARGLVEEHQGTTTISSQPGEGTLVTVRLPGSAR